MAEDVVICRHFKRTILSTVTARKADIIDRNPKYRPQYRPHNKSWFCRSFILHTSVAGDTVDVLRTFSKAKLRHKSHLLGKIVLRVLEHPRLRDGRAMAGADGRQSTYGPL